MTKKEFIENVASLVIAENEYRGNPLFSSVVIAMGCLETGYGKSSLMIKANAIFGIKATKSWKGKVYNAKTKECYDGVTYVTINDCFRAYNNFADSISDYFDLICKSSRYRKALVADTPKECITEIKNAGYATDPKYIDSIMKIIETNNLTKYDRQEKTESKESYKVGSTYTLQVNLNVRYGAGTTYKIKKYSELTKDGRKHALNQRDAVLKRGTKVTCLKIVKNGINMSKDEIWIQIPSGFICAKYGDRIYVK